MRSSPLERIVADHVHPCVYLPGETARMPLRFPVRTLTRAELDERLAAGYRRSGYFLYRPQCPACTACEAIRLDLTQFQFAASHRRVLRRGDANLEVRIDRPRADTARVEVYNRHKQGRGLAVDELDAVATLGDYASFLVDSCCETLEFSYWAGERLAAVAVADRGGESLNAVYCCFDPEYARWSPGTYSILKQVEYCRRMGLRYLYLGLYIAGSRHMNYKGRFRPHERRIDGVWRVFDG